MFEFDIVTLIAALVLSIAFASPFYYNHKKNKKNKELQTELLLKIARENGLVLTHSEFWRERYSIGLDSTSKKVLYIQFREIPKILAIDLAKVKSIELQERNHEVGSGSEKRKVIDNLDLTFYFKNQETGLTLEFFNGDIFSDMEGELPLVKNWIGLLKANLTVNTPVLV